MAILRRFQGYVTIIVLLITIVSAAQAKYSGGMGEPNDPYQIATAADLIALSETPEDYDKHFILTADIDLDPNLPGRKVFDRAVIAPDANPAKSGFQGIPFTGVLDGNGHTISRLTIVGKDYLGLLGQLGSKVKVSNLGLEALEVSGTGSFVGALVGWNASGSIATSYSSGSVSGTDDFVGGLVGYNGGSVTASYSTAAVSGTWGVGGLVGTNSGSIDSSYSTGSVSGSQAVGGLVGSGSPHRVSACVWDTETSGLWGSAGGVGLTTAEMRDPNMLGLNGFADDPNWVVDAGRDYPRLAWEGTVGQTIPQPRIDWLEGQGTADSPYRIDTPDQLVLGKRSFFWDKHFILAADIDLDPSLPGGQVFVQAVIPAFKGVFDGNDKAIRNLTRPLFENVAGTIKDLRFVAPNCDGSPVGTNYGTIVHCGVEGGVVSRGGLVGSNCGSITASYSTAAVRGTDQYGYGEGGGLVGFNSGDVTRCYSTGAVSGSDSVGGLVGWNSGNVVECHSTAAVSGSSPVGGLAGLNTGTVLSSYAASGVIGDSRVGGLVGSNGYFFRGYEYREGVVCNCYSTGAVTGRDYIAGLTGYNIGIVYECYSTGAVTGTTANVSGLAVAGEWGWMMGPSYSGTVDASFWDVQTSGQTNNDGGGTGKTTAEMQTAKTFLDAGWDFVDETANGSEDIWKIAEGLDYPRLAWENYSGGTGEPNDPYQIATAADLIALGETPEDYDKHFILTADIDLDPNLPGRKVFDKAVIASDVNDMNTARFDGTPFTAVFNGNDRTISHLTIDGKDFVGLFGVLDSGAQVKHLGVVGVRITGSRWCVGGLVGRNGHRAHVTDCYCTGKVSSYSSVGGLVGYNYGGFVTHCHSTASVRGTSTVGGLAAHNTGSVIQCYCSGAVDGNDWVGGLVGWNEGTVSHCYSTSAVSGEVEVGGLVGRDRGRLSTWGTAIGCFWDTQTSGQATSVGGTGKTTAELQTAKTFLDAGWDFVEEIENGTEDIWWILEGQDYPRLWWETQ